MSAINIQKFKGRFERESVKVMRDSKIPGMSIFITQYGEPIYARSFGLREKKDVKPATLNTLWGVSSITKSITCMGILQLHEKGKLNILDPISEYIPVNLGFKGQPITIQHLMCHRSGVPALHSFVFSQMNQELYEANVPDFPFGNWDDFYFHVNDATSEVLSPPYTKYYYWNGGFVLLGQIIEKVSGKSFEDYIKENILVPLEMHRSTFSSKEAEKDKDVTKGYNYSLKDKKVQRNPRNLLSGPFIAGSGGLISSVVEITNYLLMQLNGGEFKGKQLLDRDLIKEMWKSHNTNLKMKNSEYYVDATEAYGYGWKIYENYNGYTLITHQGVSGVTGGNVGIIPELKLTFAQLYNVSWIPNYLMHVAFSLLVGKNPEEMPYNKRKRHYRALCGEYEAYKKILSVNIEEKEGLLYLIDNNWQDKGVFPLIPRNNDPEVMDFYIILPSGSLEVPFTRHEKGQITFDYERYLMHKKTAKLE
ncbi:MAG: serine hydrolase [Candidatus Heimdallarchaeota archaeon]|nr:MAG: serine hydrolase [Candidatus Heimdallarchaeota archaeon]